MKFDISPIGIIRNEVKDRHHFEAESIISEIEIFPKFLRALDGIESFSHIVVVFWLHRIKNPERAILKVHPRQDMSLPLVGVFATRSPARFNPIGITTVKLIERDGNILKVSGLDAINGTPVLDIKPYLPEDISQAEITVPEWIKKLQSRTT